jgi:hypothetical protein
MHRAILSAGALLCLAACTTVQVGHDFALPTFEAKVQRGVTTQADVRNWLGEPTGTGVSVETSGDTLDEWTYYFGGGPLSDMDKAHLKILQVKFDHQGIVRAYNWSGGQ